MVNVFTDLDPTRLRGRGCGAEPVIIAGFYENELLAHLEAEKQRDQTAPEPRLAAPFHSAGRISIGIAGTLLHRPRRC